MSDKSKTADRLIKAFFDFRKIRWHQAYPIEGVKPSEVPLLILIQKLNKEDPQGTQVSSLSRHLEIAVPTTTQLVNRLEENNYVKRENDKTDRRFVRITLTEKGENVVKKAHEHMHKSFDELTGYLGEEDTEKLISILNKIYLFYKKNNNTEELHHYRKCFHFGGAEGIKEEMENRRETE